MGSGRAFPKDLPERTPIARAAVVVLLRISRCVYYISVLRRGIRFFCADSRFAFFACRQIQAAAQTVIRAAAKSDRF